MSTWQERYNQWNNFDLLDSNLRVELDGLGENELALEEVFYTGLTFGTGGIRGILGVGTSRLNIYTVRKSIKGLAHYLEKSQVNTKDRGVVIAYDSRHMSKEFAIEAAKVLGVHGIKTYVFEELRPTPLLSFAVRYLNTAAGIMITASHNPPEYNGFKVYNDQGSQLLEEEANEIIKYANAVEDELRVPVLDEVELEEKNLLKWVNGEVDHAYLEELKNITKMSPEKLREEKDLSIVFTPLHGTATPLVKPGLENLNFKNVHIVEEQAIPDPEFSTVDLPNPEEEQAFKRAVALGSKVNADILLATDPDADRLGVAVKDGTGKYAILTGNQLGSLLLDYILRHSDKAILKNARMLKTIVTTELGRAVAQSYGVKTIETLTGFKFIGEKINEYDSTGETFVFGYEESYGYLISSFARDKDAVQAAVMAVEMANYWKEQGKTLLDALNSLYEEHGYYKETLQSIALEGIAGQKKIKAIIDDLRETDQASFGSLAALYKEDYLQSESTDLRSGQVEELVLPKENVIKYKIANESWICVRPSGTEPKIKIYFGAFGRTEAEANERISMLEQAMDDLVGDQI